MSVNVVEGFGAGGEPIWRAYDERGELVAAWGPDVRDANGHPQSPSDEHWIATRWDGDEPTATECGTRAEVEAVTAGWVDR